MYLCFVEVGTHTHRRKRKAAEKRKFLATLFDQVNRKQYIYALFMDLQISFFNNFFIKNGSHGTIHTFKNYFTTTFSVSIFNFNKNKINPNGPNKKHPHYLIMAVRK